MKFKSTRISLGSDNTPSVWIKADDRTFTQLTSEELYRIWREEE